MDKRKLPFLLAAMLPLMPQVVAMGQEATKALLHILLLIDLLTVQGILTVNNEEMAPQGGVGEALQICLPIVEVEMGPPEMEVVLRAPLKVLHLGLPVVEIDTPVEKVVLVVVLVGVAVDRRGIMAPLLLRTLTPMNSPP